MLGITNIWVYVIGTVAIILLPGPNSMYVLSVAARRGVRPGYAAACGVFLGDGLLMTLSAAGVASLLRAAWRRWRGGARPDAAPDQPHTAPDQPHAAPDQSNERSPFLRALLVSLLNPKAVLFFVSFFVQFVDPGYPYPPAVSFLVLGAIAELCSAAYLTGLIFGGSFLASQLRARRTLSSVLTSGVGALFISFAAKLATASLR